ncbi:fibroblast growth factor-binding protein 2b [Xenentodon cancila]
MRARIRMLLLLLAATVSVSFAQTSNNYNNDNKQQPPPPPPQRSIWDEPIRFTTKAKDSCAMVLTGMGNYNYTRLRVSCRGPSQTTGRSYYCDFQGKPNLCPPYNRNPRHYFTQMMWELRKLNNACQGAKIYRPHMCKTYPDEVQMTFMTSWPKTTAVKPSKPAQEPYKPVQTKPAESLKPVKPVKPGKGSQTKKTTAKPVKTTPHPTEHPDSRASRLASEYCWKSFQGICLFIMGFFQK